MEYLDTYDENRDFLGSEERTVVHQKGLWHNTIHCWLYDNEGNIYFQIRSDENNMYTTASGHVNAGETLEEAFGREIFEEIGLNIEYNDAKLIDMVIWKMDKQKKDGSMFIDRAFANIYIYDVSKDDLSFRFDEQEVSGLVKVNAKDALSILSGELSKVNAIIIKATNNEVTTSENEITINDFLIQEHETGIEKYGHVLNNIINVTSK